jgi:hypothetical protein
MDVATSLAGLRLMKPFSTRFQQGTAAMNSDHGASCRLIPSDYDELEGALDAAKRIPCTNVIVIETDKVGPRARIKLRGRAGCRSVGYAGGARSDTAVVTLTFANGALGTIDNSRKGHTDTISASVPKG